MKARTSNLLTISVAAATAVLLVGAAVKAQSPSPSPYPLDPRMRIEHYFMSDRGDLRARLYVKLGNTWQPVAADGLADLKNIIPAK